MSIGDRLRAFREAKKLSQGNIEQRTGLTLAESADVLGIGRRTADRYWAYARAWLCDALTGGDDASPPT